MSEHPLQRLELPPDAGVIELLGDPVGGEERSERTYFDTAGRDLHRVGVLLHRAQGVDPAGWTLELPGPDGGEVLRRSDSAVLPRELADVLTGVRRGRRLSAVARLVTRSRSRRVLDPAGVEVLRLVDQLVEIGLLAGGNEPVGWRQVELHDGERADPEIAADVARSLVRAGARRAPQVPTIARVLPVPAPRRGRGGATAADVLTGYLEEQIHAVVTGDMALRRDLDVIHPTRVATRRLRSMLRVFGTFVDTDRAAALDGELAWFAGLLGEVRDRDVLLGRLLSHLDELPDELVLGPVAATVRGHLSAERVRSARALRRALNGRRYRGLLDELDRWRDRPPFTEVADGPAKRLRSGLDRAERTLRHRLARMNRADDDALHSARKAAKRLRYAAELVSTGADGAPQHAAAVARWARKLQTVLGEHQDARVSAELVHRLAAGTTQRRSGLGFTYGVLFADELHRGRRSRQQAAKLARKRP